MKQFPLFRWLPVRRLWLVTTWVGLSLALNSCLGSCGRDEPQGVYQPAPTLPAATRQPPTPAGAVNVTSNAEGAQSLDASASLLSGRFAQLNPGVVNIQMLINQQGVGRGAGVGSGFVLDEQGHIVTNNHVVDQATRITVVFFNGLQESAEVVGVDDDSDLAIIKVATLPEGVYPLPLADSDQVQVGDWAIAIGNPFGLGSSMTLGIISAVGRSIPSGVTPFNIPQAIQTDAAINPGNSGGPLFNLAGEVIGVNAQIQTSGSRSNSGVGFAIPANVVRHIAPTLIETGSYQWPWLGISGTDISLPLAEANELANQQGAYIVEVVDDGPATAAGLRGSSQQVNIEGLPVPTGGDVVVAVDGQAIASFTDMLVKIAYKRPGEAVTLTVLRAGRTLEVPVTLAPRPDLSTEDIQ